MDSIDEFARVAELSQFELTRELGRGGMGTVYKAFERSTGAPRAIKIIRPHAEPGEAANRRVLREIENCLALEHPCVVQTYSGGRAGSFYFIVMELCPGGSADQFFATHGPLQAASAFKLLSGMLSGLEYAHSAPLRTTAEDGEPLLSSGLVHRDIKPQNIFITDGDRPHAKIGDFGLAKAFQLAGLSGLTNTGSSAGTPAFMPRQQVLDYKYASPAVDVWAAVATFYFMLTGSAPRDFPPGRDPWNVVWKTAPVPLGERGIPVPPHVAAVLDEALDDVTELRVTTIPAFRDALVQACIADSIEFT